MTLTIGILHPGQMGVSVGASLVASGHQVCWVGAQRSVDTRARAAGAGFIEQQTLAELVAQVDTIVSVCPPDAALSLARSVAQLGFSGWYLDANAVAPTTAQQIAALFSQRYIDGGIIGPPALQSGTTRLYLSGAAAAPAAAWFTAGPLQVIAMDHQGCAASALKMAYASYTKGHSALLLAAFACAEQAGVGDWLQQEFAVSQPAMAKRLAGTAAAVSPKAWRFAGEMLEIAATYQAAGLPPELHQAIAELYGRLAPLRDEPIGDVQVSPEQQLTAVLQQLLNSGTPSPHG